MQYKGLKRIKKVAAVILSAALITTELPQTGIAYASETDEYEAQMTAEQEESPTQQEENTTADESGEVEESAEESGIEQETRTESIESTEAETEDNTEAASTETTETESSTEITSAKPTEMETESRTETASTETTETEIESSTENISTGITETETESSTETTSTETIETESGTEETETDTLETEENTETEGTEDNTELETTEIETLELETLATETTEIKTSVPVPEVDASVYIPKSKRSTRSFDVASARAYASVQDPVEISSNEYRIENRDQFLGFLTGKNDYNGSIVTLACNIDMKSETACYNGRFAGTFNGNGYSIQNLKVEQGLFPVIQSGAVVKNLHITNVSMTGERSAGVIAGRNDGMITNCVVTGNLEATNDMDYTGGIVGENEGNIENCVFSGRIVAAANTADAEKDIGGIAGRNNGIIRSCYAVGNINTKAAVVAGIAGTNTSRESDSIKDCANYMSVEGAYIVAGIVGINEGEVAGCTNYGAVRQKNNSQEIGEAGGIAAQNKLGTIRDCYNYVAINGEDKNIGGIAGSTSGSITRCGNIASVTGLANVGGVVGLYNGNREYSISECFNQGSINGSGRTTKSIGIGGILGSAGESYRVPIENCYNTGSIRAAKSAQYLGGIAGVIYKGSISNCYNAGSVSGNENDYAAMLVGFMGREEDTLCTSCLYIGDEQSIAFYRETGGVSDAEMAKTSNGLKSYDALSVLGGSFSSDSGENINKGYPILSGQTEPDYQYPVVYELNGGYSGSSYFELISQNSSVNKPEDPTKEYAEFQGWYSDAGLGASYKFDSSVKAPVILYAKWKNVTVVEDMELLQTDIEMIKGEEYSIKVRFTPEKAENTEMVWESNNTSAVTVDEKGVIRAEAPGRAIITGTLKDNSLSKVLELRVTVTNKDRIIHIRRVEDGAELDSFDIAVKETITLEAAAKGFSDNAVIQWGPGNNEYVKITPKVNTLGTPKAEVTGLKPTPSGSPVRVKFTVDDGDNSLSKSVDITVLPLATGVKVKLGDDDVTEKTAIYDLVTKKFIAVGTKKLKRPVEELSAVVSPRDASQKVTWESSNTSVIQFKDKESGVVTGNASGTAEVTALTKDGSNKVGKTTIRTKRIVQSFVLEPKEVDAKTPVVVDSQGRVLLTSGCSVRLVPKFTPNDVTDEGLKWEVSPKGSLTIDAEKKIITAKDVQGETKVTLKATSLDGGEASYAMEFIIIPKIESIEIYDTRDMKKPVTGKTIGVNLETDKKTFTLQVKNKPDGASQVVLWKSVNAKVADVADNKDGSCVVTVYQNGKTNIVATAADGSGITASVTINVSSLVSSITISGSNRVVKGGKIKLKAEVLPKSAENKAVYWESDDTSIATVNKNTGEVVGVKEGLVDITATAADGGGAFQTFSIKVTAAVTDFDIMIPDGNTNLEDDVIVTDKVVGVDLDAGMETYKLAARILPKEASQIVTWKSSNEKIATVDEKGIITAKSLGSVIITATTTDGSDKVAKTTVNVNTLVRSVSITGSHYVGSGQSIQLHVEVTDKDAANKNVIWTSSDKNVAVVDDSGYVTAVSKTGEAKIRAEAADGSGKYAEHIVYVMGKSDTIEITEFNGSYISSGKSSEIDMQDIGSSRRVSFVAELSGGSSQQGDYRKEVEWLTSNKAIAEVYSIQNNFSSSEVVVQIKKEGKVTITARTTDGSRREDSYTLTVTDTDPNVAIVGPKQVAKGKKIQLSTKNGVDVTWSSSDTSIATVDAKGKVTAKKNVEEGASVIITATSKKGSLKEAFHEVQVYSAVSSVDILVNGTSIKGKKIGVDLIKGISLDDGKTWNSDIRFYTSVDGASFDDRVTWKSNKTAVATVDENGKVEIKKNGTAVITATATDGSGKNAKVTLTVTKQITKIEPADGLYDVYVGYKKSAQLKLAFKPLAATTKKVTWESDDKSLVSVNKSGKVTVKRPFGSGDYDTSSDNNVIVRAIAADGGSAVCEFRIHFVAPATKVQILEQKDNINLEYASIVGIDIDTNDAKITLKADISSTNSYASQYGVSKQATWKSSNPNIAEVTPNYDGTCTVTGHSNGKVTITATATDGSKKSGKVTLYVGKMIQHINTTKDIQGSMDNEGREIITLYVKSVPTKKTLQLSDKLIFSPSNATNKKLTYKSSDSKLVSVSSSGKLTAKKRGAENVIITITANDGSRVKKEIVVRVLQ